MATGSSDSIVSLWDLEELACVRTFARLEFVLPQFHKISLHLIVILYYMQITC
jgi:hypothetical protein